MTLEALLLEASTAAANALAYNPYLAASSLTSLSGGSGGSGSGSSASSSSMSFAASEEKQASAMAASQFGPQVSKSPRMELAESKTNLIINYLPQGMTQEEVRALFSSIGEIESCKLVREKMSGQSLGYGFVNYVAEEDASRAVASFNGLRLQNKTIKVSYARPSAEGIKGANLYVSGLPKSMTQRELVGLFRPFGQIITSRILSDNITGLSKGVGFVRFDKRGEAEGAIEKLNGTVPDGCTEQITVKFANNPANNPSKSALADVASLASAASAAAAPAAAMLSSARLAAAAAAAAAAGGPIRAAAGGGSGAAALAASRAAYRYNPLAGVPLQTLPSAAAMAAAAAAAPQAGCYTANDLLATQAALFGYPTAASLLPTYNAYNMMMAAAAASSSLSPSGGAASGHAAAASGGAAGAGFTLFVYNLASDTEDAVLWALFGPFGTVQSVKIIRDFATGKGKGYGFVTLAGYDEAVQAVTALNGTQLGNRTIQIREADAATILAASAQEASSLGMLQGMHGSYDFSALM